MREYLYELPNYPWYQKPDGSLERRYSGSALSYLRHVINAIWFDDQRPGLFKDIRGDNSTCCRWQTSRCAHGRVIGRLSRCPECPSYACTCGDDYEGPFWFRDISIN